MLVDQSLMCPLILQILHTVAVHLLAQIIQHLDQTPIVGSTQDHIMKMHIRICAGDQILAFQKCRF